MDQTTAEITICPECGTEESGFFCRNCGALLRGEDYIFCPRCHQIVPPGEFCNRCGQSLGGIALRLQQLALAGDEFWVTVSQSPTPPPAEPVAAWEPDETVQLADADLPDWLHEISPESAPPPDVESRIYPALQPIKEEQAGSGRNFVMILVLLMFVLMLGIAFLAIFALLSGG